MSIVKKIRGVFQSKRELIVMPFGGYANHNKLHTQARVLKDKHITPSEKDTIFKNFLMSYKRLESDEKGGETVVVSWEGQKKTTVSDSDGYIMIDDFHELNFANDQLTWIPVTYKLVKDDEVLHEDNSEIMKPSEHSQYGIISDLDDTVLYTGVSSFFKWKLLVNSLFVHSNKRTPLPGAKEFYTLLCKGTSSTILNPFFYLSNSPWNLYDYLQDFLAHFEFPKGVLLLRDIEISFRRKRSFMEGDKYKKIIHVLETYPNLAFILIGDASEEDLDIYLHIAKNYPERVLAIYIRAVKRKSKMRRVEALIEEYTDIEVVIMTDGKRAIKHARTKGFIR